MADCDFCSNSGSFLLDRNAGQEKSARLPFLVTRLNNALTLAL